MDLKAISWVGNIYQKFEAMCLEVEEVMYQDTIDYVENQAQTVGASMKKFYSEIMQDLHPESYIDPAKVAAADLSLNPYAHSESEKKKKARSLKEHSRGIDMKFTEDTEVIKGKSRQGGIYKRRSVGIRKNTKDNYTPSQMPLPVTPMFSERTRKSSARDIREGCDMASDHSAKGCASREMVEEIRDHKSDTNMHTTGSSIDNAVSDMTLKVEYAEQKKEDSGCTSTLGGSLSGSSGTPHGHLTEGTISHTDATTISNGSAERPENHDFDVLEAYDVLEQDAEVDREAESLLEETCVLVVGDEPLTPQYPVKHKSYKKKIREAFSSKMRLTRKEYENLATRYENQPLNQDSEEKAVPALGRKASTKISASEFPDSEWELL